MIGDVTGKTILVDDMIDGGARRRPPTLIANGAASVVIATTTRLSDPAVERLKASQCEGGLHQRAAGPPEKLFGSLTQLSIAPLLARAIRAVFDDGSVTSLFDGEV